MLDEPDDLDDVPLTRSSYRMACSQWRRKEPTPLYRVRGVADLLVIELGIRLLSVSVWVGADDGDVGIRFASRTTMRDIAPPSAIFRDARSRNRFAEKAWAAIQHGFPDAATCAIGIVHQRGNP